MDFQSTLLNFKNTDDRIKFAATLPDKLVLEICSKNTELTNSICLNENYWKLRYLKNNKQPTTTPKSWKELYFNDKNDAYSCGFNMFGELGLGDSGEGTDRNKPTRILNIKPKSVHCGGTHSIIVDTDRNAWSFGRNNTSQLGLGDNNNRHTLTQIQTPSGIKVKQVSLGDFFSMIIDTDSNVWSFGYNISGQLGLGDEENRNTPTQIQNVKAKQIACGHHHSMIINMNDYVWSFGNNEFGQLGFGDNYEEDYISTPTQIQNVKAKQIACGGNHSMIIDLNDNVWSFGHNNHGQLGLSSFIDKNIPTRIPNIKAKQIACGGEHSMILDTNGNVWSFGSNHHGQLGLGNNASRNTPTQIQNIQAKQIACGYDQSMILDLNDNVWSFGYNAKGGLGLGDNIRRNLPTQIPNITAKQISCGFNYSMILSYNSLLISFDEITLLFSSNEVTKFEFESSTQVYYKSVQGIYTATFILKDGTKKYGYVRYNSSTNQILKP